MKTKKGYKVVYKPEGRKARRSLGIGAYLMCDTIFEELSKASVEHPLEEWVKPNLLCGPLAVFSSLPRARRWAQGWAAQPHAIFGPGEVLVHECEYTPALRKKLHTPGIIRPIAVKNKRDVPEGTVFAKRVKLSKEILGKYQISS